MKAKQIKEILSKQIKKVVSKVQDYCTNPEKNFTRIVNFLWKKLLKE